jgi:hypothetical protein
VSGFEDNPAAYRSDQTPVGRLVRDIRERIGLKVFENADYYDVIMEPPSFGKGARSGVWFLLEILQYRGAVRDEKNIYS